MLTCAHPLSVGGDTMVLLVTVRGMIFQLAPDTGHTAVPDDACSAVRVRVNIRNI